MIQVKTFYAHNDLRNFSYLIYDDQSGQSWVIDPYDAVPMIEYIKKNSLELCTILNTHQHSDHTRGNSPLNAAFGSEVKRLKNGETVYLSQSHALETLDTPGHTLDHQVFFLSESKKKLALFSGDTLFNAGVGNCKNGGDVELLYRTTNVLKDLPNDILLYPGHDYIEKNLEFADSLEPENKTIREALKLAKAESVDDRRHRSLREEKAVNPFFRLRSEELRKTLESQVQSERELFKKIRSLRDQW